MSLDPSADKQYFDLVRRLLVENYCILASSALLWYDHVVSFDQEFQRIWQRKFSGASLLFLVTRYSGTLERITLVASLFLVTTDDRLRPCSTIGRPLERPQYIHRRRQVFRRCSRVFTTNTNNTPSAFAALRLYAIFGRNWKLLALLISFALTRVGIAIYLQTHYTPIAFGPPLWGCGAAFNVDSDLYYRLNTATNALSLGADTLLLVFTWVRTLGIRRASYGVRGVHTPITSLLLRDGTLYFVLICAIQIFAIISIQIGSDFPLFAVWTYFSQSFTIIFLCRFMLNLRGVHTAPGGTLTEDAQSALDFASHVIGNLGAPLHLGSADEDASASDMSVETATATTATYRDVEAAGKVEILEILEVPRSPRTAGAGKPPEKVDTDETRSDSV